MCSSCILFAPVWVKGPLLILLNAAAHVECTREQAGLRRLGMPVGRHGIGGKLMEELWR